MKVLMSLGIVITLSLVGGSVEAKAAGCEAIGNVRFICDQLGPEDLVAVPRSDWVLSSGMAANGAIRLINLRDKSTTVLFPSAASRERPNKKTYESCPGPIGSEGDKFRAHGLYLRPGQNAVHTLYVVHHGGRESIEVFELDARPKAPTLTWIGCAVAPDPIGLNSVVGLSDGGFITTNFLPRGTDAAARERMMAGEINGEVWEWHPGTGWKKVPGSDRAFADIERCEGQSDHAEGPGTHSPPRYRRVRCQYCRHSGCQRTLARFGTRRSHRDLSARPVTAIALER